ncbi:hypothetical protein Anas_08170 [Armadillidium nasatum]|uniref:Uncharacterized protein n=1 Tax=Armadillidium nasatum TaxID=96803 RepID=A0A5N5TKX9_9CRUS|nr:hypothetical protein Anas_08170 [Armadillidium nasatum]
MSSLPIETEYEPLADRPLFGVGETRPRDRTINIIIVVVTCFIVLFTYSQCLCTLSKSHRNFLCSLHHYDMFISFSADFLVPTRRY